jgi:hypothetical protein
MNKHKYPLYIIVVAAYVSQISASEDDREFEKHSKKAFGIATLNHRKMAQHLENSVNTVDKALNPERLEKSASAFTAGLLAGADDKVLAQKADLLGDRFGEAAGAALVTGMAGAVKSGLVASPGAAKAAVVAAVTSPLTVPVLAGAATAGLCGGLGWIFMNEYRQKEYGYCLRTHFNSPSINEEKMPRRCESPERRAMWWDKKWTNRQKRIFKILKEEGRQPRPAIPGTDLGLNRTPHIFHYREDLGRKEKE